MMGFFRPWYLFLDDERYPSLHVNVDKWRIARNVADARWYVETFGLPEHMSLDHDLGARRETGMDFVKWFCDYVMDDHITNTFTTTWVVHSQNPVGAENMRSYLDNFKRSFEEMN